MKAYLGAAVVAAALAFSGAIAAPAVAAPAKGVSQNHDAKTAVTSTDISARHRHRYYRRH